MLHIEFLKTALKHVRKIYPETTATTKCYSVPCYKRLSCLVIRDPRWSVPNLRQIIIWRSVFLIIELINKALLRRFCQSAVILNRKESNVLRVKINVCGETRESSQHLVPLAWQLQHPLCVTMETHVQLNLLHVQLLSSLRLCITVHIMQH